MKNVTSVGMLAAIAFGVGMVGMNFSDGTFVMQSSTPSSTMEAGTILGHIEVIHTDSEGNILSYQQTDNAIVNDGRNCTRMLLFGPDAAGTGCGAKDAAGLGKYTVIGIGNGSALTATTLNTVLSGETTVDGLVAQTGNLGTFVNASANSDPAGVTISQTFSYVGVQASNPINQAGLFNDTTIGADRGVFALKNFPSTVNMNSGDDLTVNWAITIDGSDDIS